MHHQSRNSSATSSGATGSGATNSGAKYMLAGGSVIAALGLLAEPRGLFPKPASAQSTCQEIVQEKAVISRDQLTQLMEVPERANKEQIRQVLKGPYCRLANFQLKSGGLAQQEAYPLAFDPQTWFVVLYEGDQYAGYSFSFRH